MKDEKDVEIAMLREHIRRRANCTDPLTLELKNERDDALRKVESAWQDMLRIWHELQRFDDENCSPDAIVVEIAKLVLAHSSKKVINRK